MPEFNTAGLDDRLKHLEYKFDQDRQVMAAKWDAEMRAMKSKLQIEVARGRMGHNEATMRAKQFSRDKQTQAMEFMNNFNVERDRLKTFYQAAEPEEMDPVKAYRALLTEKNAYESELDEFQVYGSGNVVDDKWYHRKKKVPFEGGGVQYKERILAPDGKGGQKTVTKLRMATPTEIRRWARAQAGLSDVNQRLARTRTNRHIAARNSGSAFDPTGGGTMGDQVKRTMPKPPQPQPELTAEAMRGMSEEELNRILAGG